MRRRDRIQCIAAGALSVALTASMAPAASDSTAARDLAAAIAAQGDRLVQFHYAARSGVYGDNHNLTIRDPESAPWECCAPCSVQVTVRRRDGEIRSIRWRIGRVRKSVPPGGHDLGAVSARQAAAYFMQHALDAESDAESEALQAAVLADVDDQWPQLARLARDRQRSQELRRNAIFWLGMDAQEAVTKTLGQIADDDTEDLEIRKHAIFAISQRPDAESIPALVRMAQSHANAEVRKTALFWLAQKDSPEVIDLFEKILRGDS
jgi:hypothetical protein